MLSIELHLVTILMLASGQAYETCKEQDISHLVHSLQDCANAITGLQPSSEIQEKCSPDGLLQKIETITLTLANITKQIAAIEENIATNNKTIAETSADIQKLFSGTFVCNSYGWNRVAYLDMSDLSQQCPNDFHLYDVNGVRACGRQYSLIGTCHSVTYSTNGISYSEVCGRVIGYQVGSTDGVVPQELNPTIDSSYVKVLVLHTDLLVNISGR